LEPYLARDPALRDAADIARNSWVAYEPALTLYELSVTPNDIELTVALLEVELELSAGAHGMLVNLAQLKVLETWRN
jgi:hypothetical protein